MSPPVASAADTAVSEALADAAPVEGDSPDTSLAVAEDAPSDDSEPADPPEPLSPAPALPAPEN